MMLSLIPTVALQLPIRACVTWEWPVVVRRSLPIVYNM
jgi:hypothetical protein